MQSSMTLSSIAALFGAMIVLASIPSVSVLTVSARSAVYGLAHGVFTTLGILAGDIVFILLAIYGLSVLADTMGGLFIIVQYIGGAYLIWLGTMLWKSQPKAMDVEGSARSSLLSSFLTGLLITLGDQKAILFYFGFFPAFIDLSAVTLLDTGIIIAITTLALGGVKLGYAFMARAGALLHSAKAHQRINRTAGLVMISVGVFVMARA